MDFETVLTILLVLFYFIAQAAGRKKKPGQQKPRPKQRKPERLPQQQPVPPVEAGRKRAEPDYDMEKALAEIRTALGFPEPEKRPEPPKPPPPARLPAPVKQREPEFRKPEWKEAAAAEKFEHSRMPVEFTRPEIPAPAPRPVPKEKPAPTLAAPVRPQETASPIWPKFMRSRETLRDAFVLSEVLGPPRSRTGPANRRP